MINRINPFHELYVTESFGADSFVRLFSDVLINHTAALFKPGNIILKGLPGTGKTMMLSLLEPGIRIAYKKRGVKFPVPAEFNKFIGAGINLIRSSVADFGQRPVSSTEDVNELSIYFADFVNYWIVRDILLSIDALSLELSEEIGIDTTQKKIDEFALSLKDQDCWFGYLDDVFSYEDLKTKLKDRIMTYRSYLHFNIDEIPSEISKSKTAIGTPILKTVQLLRDFNVIDKNVQVFIKIDQYEELSWLDQVTDGIGKAFKSVINKLLAIRDSSVSYRVGTRPFAWNEDIHQIFGSSARLELSRNYLEISIDKALRRSEDRKNILFPKFAEDILEKRLKFYNFSIPDKDIKSKSNLLTTIFGKGMTPREKASKYLLTSKEKAIVLDPKWPEDWKMYLRNLAQTNPLSARFGEAWARQRGKENIVNNIPKDNEVVPWENKNKEWWRKERIEQGLIQIASRNNQQLIWEGKDDILNLSGGNILAFLNLCQEIWEVWMRDSSKDELDYYKLHQIDSAIQTLGILQASSTWFNKISSVKGGKERKQFVRVIGVFFQRILTEDKNMSYPGRNGFSLEVQEQEQNILIDKFLKEASDFGDLQEMPHTSKEKNKRKRIKWYLNPILSPYFKIPAAHTKEPYYTTITEVEHWYEAAINDQKITAPMIRSAKVIPKNGQTSLFD